MPYSTRQQQAVLRCLRSDPERALSAAELAEELRSGGVSVGLATIYRQLEKLERAGAVHRFDTGEGALYQYCPRQTDHSNCMMVRCERCGRFIHLDCDHLRPLCDHVAAEHGFRIDPRRTVLTGLCARCEEGGAVFGAE